MGGAIKKLGNESEMHVDPGTRFCLMATAFMTSVFFALGMTYPVGLLIIWLVTLAC